MIQDVAPDAPAAVLPSTCKLYLGDCLSVMPILKPTNVSMVFADLPYMSTHRESSANTWDKEMPLVEFWKTLNQLKLSNAALLFTASQPFSSLLVLSNIKQFRYDIIWDKVIASRFLHAKRMPLCRHEHVLVFGKGALRYNPQMIARLTPITRTGATSTSKNYRQPNRHALKQATYTHKYPDTIFGASKREKTRLHPTQKPIALLEWLIKTYTNPGDTVLDPVFGSCTTGVACARLGRNFIGIEKDPEYFRVGRERVDAERANLGLQSCEVNP